MQPAHIVMFFSSLVIIYLNIARFFHVGKLNKIGLIFLALVGIINIIYAILYQDKSFIVNTLYWIYGFTLMFAILCCDWSESLIKWIPKLIAIKLILIVLSYFFGLGSYQFWPRYDYFFNSPNQLAYFTICLFLIYLCVARANLNYLGHVIYASSIFIIISTGGRSAYLAIIPIIIILLILAWKRPLILIISISIPAGLIFIFNHFCFPLYATHNSKNVRIDCSAKESVFKNTQERIQSLTLNSDVVDNSSVKVQLEARGYERAIKFSQYLLIGAGQGREDRFGDFKDNFYEIHSSLFAIWFYYGIAGLALFCLFVYKLIPIKTNLLMLSPLFVYGLFTFGLRSPYVWMAFGFLALAPNLFNFSYNASVEK